MKLSTFCREMEDATNAMQSVEQEKNELNQNTAELQRLLEVQRNNSNCSDKDVKNTIGNAEFIVISFLLFLQELETEKKRIVAEFSQRESETLKLSQEKESLSATTQTLQDSLKEIENKTQQLLTDKREIEER